MATSKFIFTKIIKLTLSKPTVGVYPCLTQIRWRKPRWVPKAPSKEFVVREPTPIDPVEHEELKWRYSTYRAQVEGIREYLKIELEKKQATEHHVGDDFEELYMSSESMVAEWNQEVAALREARQAEEDTKEKEKQKQIEDQRSARLLRMMTEAEQKLAYNKSQNFITMENLDEEVEKVLDVQTQYEYAIDSEGYRYTHTGKEPLPNKDKKSHPG